MPPHKEGFGLGLAIMRNIVSMLGGTIRLDSRMGKINQYTANEIEKKKDRNYGMAALFYRPLVRFFRAYIQKGRCSKQKRKLSKPVVIH